MREAAPTALRTKVARLIAVRATVGTLLLGSAIITRVAVPGAVPDEPFFLLIGVIYALTVVYALTLNLVETRRWLVDVQLAGDALIVENGCVHQHCSDTPDDECIVLIMKAKPLIM